MDDTIQALIMAFSVIVLIIALSLAMYLFSMATSTSEKLALYNDSTLFYDNIVLDITAKDFSKMPLSFQNPVRFGLVRAVTADTVIPTLYRYYKENFCVKIYDAREEGKQQLVQLFDVNIEGQVNAACKNTKKINSGGEEAYANRRDYSLCKIYDKKPTNSTDPAKGYYLFEVPWLGSTKSQKARIDYFIDGKAGFINGTYVDYSNNEFFNYINSTVTETDPRTGVSIERPKLFVERFTSYSYDGSAQATEEGEEIVWGGSNSKDKIIIEYLMVEK